MDDLSERQTISSRLKRLEPVEQIAAGNDAGISNTWKLTVTHAKQTYEFLSIDPNSTVLLSIFII